jgi:aryl-alcohol dehydrogenase-like predicted oxidoreductase
MEHRRLGASDLNVPVFSFGTATFGGEGEFFKAWGHTDLNEAKRLVDICIDSGLNFFDTANVYSKGLAESILGQALEGKHNQVLLSTKASLPMGDQPGEFGSSRAHLLSACEDSLKRLRTDHIDIFHMHAFDSFTPVDETLRTLEDLIQSGKVRHIACSNFSGWQLMKSLSVSDKNGWNRYIAHQAYYSLIGRELEWELMPLGVDQNVSTIVWSPLAGGALSGKIRRGQPAPKESRLGQIKFVSYDSETLYRVIDILDEIAKEHEKTVSQIALNWVLRKPTVANIVIGARNEAQLKQNLGAIGWKLTDSEVARLDSASELRMLYPYWHQRSFPQLSRRLPSVAQ